MSRTRTRKLLYRKNWREHWWKADGIYIHKAGWWYPDGSFRTDKPERCVWKQFDGTEHEGWPACTLQLVCRKVCNYRTDSEHGALGRCDCECRDEAVREAIEAFVTLMPDIN